METSDLRRPEGSALQEYSSHNILCRPEARRQPVKDIPDHMVLVFDPVTDIRAALALLTE